MKNRERDSHIIWRRLTSRYVLALTTVAILTIIGQVVIHIVIDQQLDDANVINIAGRQRMLSQKIAKASLAYVHADTDETKDGYLRELEVALALWEGSGLGLQYGSDELGLAGDNSLIIRQSYSAIDSSFQAIKSSVNTLLAQPDLEVEQEVLDTLLAHEATFLSVMDSIVFQYAEESQTRVEWLRLIEVGLGLFTLMTLLLEGLFIFRPSARKVREAFEVKERNARLLKMNNELEKTIIRAEEATRLKGAFLANMSHEIRTPMNGVLGMTELLSSTPLSDDQTELVETIQLSADSLLQIINDILDFSKIEEGKLKIVKNTFDIHKLVKETILIVSASIHNKPLTIRQIVNPGVPKFIGADATRVQQVLTNLLSNAVKFTSEGEVNVDVSVRFISEENLEIHFAVTDTGIGIPADRLPIIFESFEQADSSTTRKYGGTGLGLAICKRLCEMMGGRIWAESVQGEGSVFHFTIEADAVYSVS